jgi:hypothetical protein
VRQFESDTVAALWGSAFLLLPLTLAPTEGGGLSGSADYAFAAFATAAVLALARWMTAPNVRSGIVAGLLLGAIVLTKQEAVLWLVAIAVALLATMLLRRASSRRSAIICALPIGFLVVTCLALAGRIARDIPPSPYFRAFGDALRLEWLMRVWIRVPFIVQFAVRELCSSRLFGLIWPCSILALVLRRREKAPTQVVFLRYVVTGIATAYLLAFMLTPLHLEYQLRTALFRLAVHFLPLVIVLAAEQMQAAGMTGQLRGLFERTDELPADSTAEIAVEGAGEFAQPSTARFKKRRSARAA